MRILTRSTSPGSTRRLRRPTTFRQRLAALGAVASIAIGAVPVLAGPVAASSLDYMPNDTAYLQLDPLEATVAPDETHVFTVGAYDSSDNFLGDVTGVDGVNVYSLSGLGECIYDSGPQVYLCSGSVTGDFTIVAQWNGGGGGGEAAIHPLATGEITDAYATLHVTDGGGTGSTVQCSTTPCNVPPITGSGPDAVNNVNHLTFSGGDVTATADFIPAGDVVSHCDSTNPIGDAVDVRLYGNNLDSITLTMTTIIIIPKATLHANHADRTPLDKFNICFGAAYLPGDGTSSDAWLQKNLAPPPHPHHPPAPKLIPADGPEFDGTFQRFWGVAADCKAKGLLAVDPCIQLRTKRAKDLYKLAPWAQSAGLMHDGDIAIVIRTMAPWDGKAGIYS